MPRTYQAAVLHAPRTPLVVETVHAADLKPTDVLVRIRAAGLCHTDLEVIDGSLRNPMPIILGHEAAGTVEDTGSQVRGLSCGDHVVLSWNPHCGHCFYCDRNLPILCETYLAQGPVALAFDGVGRAWLPGGRDLRQLMYLGTFGEYCIVPDQQAIIVPRALPFDQASLIGCAVMTGVGAATNVATINYGDVVMVIGCGAVGLAAVQGARLAGAGKVLAVDLHPEKLTLATRLGATAVIDASREDPVTLARDATNGRGADVVLESAGSPAAFRVSAEAVRPGGEVIWLGKIDVGSEVSLRWGSLMGEKRIRRSSYGGARPHRDFPLLAQACLDGKLLLDPLITARIGLDEINSGFEALRAGKAIRSVVVLN